MKREREESITQARAMGPEFCLSAKDLAALNFTEVPNPHFRRAGAPMKLYVLEDVRAAAHAKHGGAAGVEAAAAKRSAAADKRRATVQGRCDHRRLQLVTALGKFGLELRADSKLCESYINRAGSFTIDQVVRRMCEMRFLHHHTHYVDILHDIRRDIREMGERWDSDETADDAEVQAVGQAGGWPARWPWLPQAWTKETHGTYSKRFFRDPVRAFVLCLNRTPVGAVDPETKAGIVERIVCMLAQTMQ